MTDRTFPDATKKENLPSTNHHRFLHRAPAGLRSGIISTIPFGPIATVYLKTKGTPRSHGCPRPPSAAGQATSAALDPSNTRATILEDLQEPSPNPLAGKRSRQSNYPTRCSVIRRCFPIPHSTPRCLHRHHRRPRANLLHPYQKAPPNSHPLR